MQDEWLECQRNWLYLESIFSAPDIQRQLPNEAKMFTQVDKSWKEIMRYVQKFPNCIKAGTRPGWLYYIIINFISGNLEIRSVDYAKNSTITRALLD